MCSSDLDSNPRKVALHTLSKRADSAALAPLPGRSERVAAPAANVVRAGEGSPIEKSSVTCCVLRLIELVFAPTSPANPFEVRQPTDLPSLITATCGSVQRGEEHRDRTHRRTDRLSCARSATSASRRSAELTLRGVVRARVRGRRSIGGVGRGTAAAVGQRATGGWANGRRCTRSLFGPLLHGLVRPDRTSC